MHLTHYALFACTSVFTTIVASSAYGAPTDTHGPAAPCHSETRSAPCAAIAAHESAHSRAPRLVLQTLIGAGAEVGLGFVGAAIGLDSCNDRDLFFPCASEGTVGLLIGGTIGAVSGVYLTGETMDGRGKFWATGLGGLVGTGIGFLAAGGLYQLSENTGDKAGIPILIAAPLAGSLLGYELSVSPRETELASAHVQDVRLLAAPLSGGGMRIGMQGRF